jgi:spore coat protein U-like protein
MLFQTRTARQEQALVLSPQRSQAMPMKSALRVTASGFLALAAFAPLHAATARTSFSVSVTVQSGCAVSAQPMRFGTYTGAPLSANSAVSVQCTQSTPYSVGLSAGLGQGATVANRMMIGPSAAQLRYLLSSDAQGTAAWGQTVGIDTVGGTGDGSIQAISVYGKIPSGQYIIDGPYADTITVTVTY